MTDTRARLEQIVREHAAVGPDFPITDDTTFRTDLGLDSLDIVELSMRLEDAFNLPYEALDDAELDTFGAVGEQVELALAKHG